MDRLAVISDVHSNIIALESVLTDIRTSGCDYIVCCGDLVGYGPWPNEVVQRIVELGIPCVMGNYDEAVGFLLPSCGCHIGNPFQRELSTNSLKWTIEHTAERTRELLRALPETYEIEFGGKRILLVHTTMDSITEYIYEGDNERITEVLEGTEQDVYIYGHTHFPYIKQVMDKLIINAGSVGKPKDCDNRASYVMLTAMDDGLSAAIRRVPYDVEGVAREIETTDLNPYFAECIRNGGDPNDACDESGGCSCTIESPTRMEEKTSWVHGHDNSMCNSSELS